jgi:hypothetical protein
MSQGVPPQATNVNPRFLAILRAPPTRGGTALLTFGLMLGVPGGIFGFGLLLGLAIDAPELVLIATIFAGLAFVGATIAMWWFILTAASKLKEAERLIFAGDYLGAAERAQSVLRSVFRADYRMSAHYMLSLCAEHTDLLPEAESLWKQTLLAIPAMAATAPGKRVRALVHAHRTMVLTKMGDFAGARIALQNCHRELAISAPDGVMRSFLMMDDSAFGAVGINTQLAEVEAKRNPHPLAILAGAHLAYATQNPLQAYHLLNEQKAQVWSSFTRREAELATWIEGQSATAAIPMGAMRTPAME